MKIDFKDIMDYATVNRENYQQLKQQIQRCTVIPFVGAGLSACVYPDWNKVLEIIASDIMDLSAKETVLKLLTEEYISSHKDALEQAAKVLENIWTKSIFDNKLYHIFSPEKLEKAEIKEMLCKEAAAVLPVLFPQGVALTTNYDHVLEKMYETYGNGIHACDVLHQERLNKRLKEMSVGSLLIKLHGDVEESSTSVILNSESYNKAYQNDSPLVTTLQKCYNMKNMLFLGCSLEHDRTIAELQKTLEPGSLHFAVYPCEKDGAALQNTVRHFGEKNILPILYPKGQYICVRLILEQLLMELYWDRYCQLPFRIMESESHSDSLAERLAPETRAAAFCGRDKEFRELLHFCKERKEPFLWWAVTGDGGTGKTRISYELSICMRKAGWNVFFLKKYSDYQNIDMPGIQNGKNTLYILDRVIGYEEKIGNWMEEKYQQTKGSIVRVLLLERKSGNFSQDGWLNQILYGAEVPGILEESCYNPQMLDLPPINKEDLKKLIVSYGNICAEDLSSADVIMDQLEKVDSGKTRPLYAILLVEVWKKGDLNKTNTRNKLLEYIWKAEFSRYQTFFINQNKDKTAEAKACAKVFLKLKLAASLVNGIEWSKIHENFQSEWEDIAFREDSRKMMISSLEENYYDGIASMQPDLLADYFILREAEQNKAVFEYIFAKSWKLSSIECFARIQSIMSDFPEKLQFLKQVSDMHLSINSTQQSNMYALLIAGYASLQKDLSYLQQTAIKIAEIMQNRKDNSGLKYPFVLCTALLCCKMNSFEEKWKYLKVILELSYVYNANGKKIFDMMLANITGNCLASFYYLSLTKSEFQKVENERKRLLSEIRHLNPLYFYMLGALFGTTLLTFYVNQKSIQVNILVSLLKELLVTIDKNESVRLIYIQNYMSSLLFQMEKTNGKKIKKIWYQVDEMYHKEAVLLIDRTEKTEIFLPPVCCVWSIREKSLELILRNIYENNQKIVENIVGKKSQTNAAATIKSLYLYAMRFFMNSTDEKSSLEFLGKLKQRYLSASEIKKLDEADVYSYGLMYTYDYYGWNVYCNIVKNSDKLMKQFQLWEFELRSLEDAYDSKQIHDNWIEVLTTSTYTEQDIDVLRKKVKIIKEAYETRKEIPDNGTELARKQYSMALNNLCRLSNNQSECKQIIPLQWALYNETAPDSPEKEAFLWEIAKTINNNVTTAGSLEECQKYSNDIQKIVTFKTIRSDEMKEKILLEYAKSLVNRFLKISSDMADQRNACIQELETLYLNSGERNSSLKDQFLVRLILGLNNAAAACTNIDEALAYLEKKEKLLKLLE